MANVLAASHDEDSIVKTLKHLDINGNETIQDISSFTHSLMGSMDMDRESMYNMQSPMDFGSFRSRSLRQRPRSNLPSLTSLEFPPFVPSNPVFPGVPVPPMLSPTPFSYDTKYLPPTETENQTGLVSPPTTPVPFVASSFSVADDSEGRAYMWSGELPPRNYSHPIFSPKIFVGGVPWDVSEDALVEAFAPYGKVKVEWPGSEARFNRGMPMTAGRPGGRGKVTGYVYMIYDDENSVKGLLKSCSQEYGSAGEWYFRLKARRNNTVETRQVQIIPWVVSDAAYVDDPAAKIDTKKTVFVGALHGMITAHVLFSIMNELYGNVVFVGIDTDKYKYPIGSGRVTFASHSSYFRAIECAFLEIKTSKFKKRVQIDPFLEETFCQVCRMHPGPFFCRDRGCFRYHCAGCWLRRHVPGSQMALHRYLTRNAPRPTRDLPLNLYHNPTLPTCY